jgi:hypothetical protein
MGTKTLNRIGAVVERLGPGVTDETNRTLWRCRMRIPGGKPDEFLFKSSEEFIDASGLADQLLAESPSCKMVGATILAVERVARLWN